MYSVVVGRRFRIRRIDPRGALSCYTLVRHGGWPRKGPPEKTEEGAMSSRFSLDGRVAVITGGGTGIGRGAALVLAEHGADVVLAGRRPDPLESTAKEVTALGRRVLGVSTDVTSMQACQQLIDTALEEFGRV